MKKDKIRLHAAILLPCVALGLSPFVMQASESIISVCFNSSLLKYGGDVAVGAMTICTSVMQFAMLPLRESPRGLSRFPAIISAPGMPSSAGDLAGILLPSNQRDVFRGIMAVHHGGTGAFGSMFTSNPELLMFAKKALRIYCGAMFIFGIQIACQMTFISTGNAVCSIIVAVVRKFVLLLPLIYIVPHLVSGNRCGVPGGAGGGYYCGDIYGSVVRKSVPEGAGTTVTGGIVGSCGIV